MRVDDWDEDSGEEPVESAAVAPAPTAPTAATPNAPGASAADTMEKAAEEAPTVRPKPPLSAVLPIYIIGIVSISTICLMFAIVMVLIFTR